MSIPYKAVLEFDLSDVDGQSAFEDAVAGTRAKLVIHALGNELRNRIKHPTEFQTGGFTTACEHMLKELRELCTQYNIPLEV